MPKPKTLMVAAAVAVLVSLGSVAYGSTRSTLRLEALSPMDCDSGLLNGMVLDDIVDPNAPAPELPDPVTQAKQLLSDTRLAKVYGDDLQVFVTFESEDEYIVSAAVGRQTVAQFTFWPAPSGWTMKSMRSCSPRQVESRA
jgi:hypothetical protein